MAFLELKVPPALVTAAFAGLMWLAASFTPSLTVGVPGSTALGVAFVAAGVVVALAGVIAFRRSSTTVNPVRPEAASSLVRSGIYRITRNPMYLGFLLMLMGWAVVLANLASLLIAALFVTYMNRFQIRSEERALRARFGASFEAYARSVRRWL